MCCGRFLLFVLNFVVFGVGVGLIALASIVIDRSNQYGDLLMDGILTLPIWTIVVGIVITIIGFFGCWGSLRQSKCMLYMYATIVFLLFVGQIALGILILVKQDEAKAELKKAMMTNFEKYDGQDKAWAKTIDLMENELKCCGVNNYTDWFEWLDNNKDKKDVTSGCCLDDTDSETCYKAITSEAIADTKIHTQGCYDAFIGWVDTITLWLGIVAIVLALIQLACVFFACSQAKNTT